MQDPAVDTVTAFTGGAAGRQTNTGRMFIALKPIEKRKASARPGYRAAAQKA